MGRPAWGSTPDGVSVQLNPALAERSANPLGTNRMVRDWELLKKQLEDGYTPGPLSQAERDKRMDLKDKFTKIDRFEAAFQRWNNSSYLNVKVPGDGRLETKMRPNQSQVRAYTQFLRSQATKIADAINAGDKKLAAQERKVLGKGVENYYMRYHMPSNAAIFQRAHRDLHNIRVATNQTATRLSRALKNGNWKSVLAVRPPENSPTRVAALQRMLRTAQSKQGPARTKAMAQFRRVAQANVNRLKGYAKSIDTRLDYIKTRADAAGHPLKLSKAGEVRGLGAKNTVLRSIARQHARAFGASVSQAAMKKTIDGPNSPLSAANITKMVSGSTFRPPSLGVRKTYTVQGQKG